MKIRKILLTLSGILVLSMGSFGITSSAAGNYRDTTYEYRFSDYTPYLGWVTEAREKLDYTSSYMKCTSAPSGHSYTARVAATNELYFGVLDGVGSPTYTFSKGTTRYMINYVKENGYKYAVIGGMPNDNAIWTASGLWSPDSI